MRPVVFANSSAFSFNPRREKFSFYRTQVTIETGRVNCRAPVTTETWLTVLLPSPPSLLSPLNSFVMRYIQLMLDVARGRVYSKKRADIGELAFARMNHVVKRRLSREYYMTMRRRNTPRMTKRIVSLKLNEGICLLFVGRAANAVECARRGVPKIEKVVMFVRKKPLICVSYPVV